MLVLQIITVLVLIMSVAMGVVTLVLACVRSENRTPPADESRIAACLVFVTDGDDTTASRVQKITHVVPILTSTTYEKLYSTAVVVNVPSQQVILEGSSQHVQLLEALEKLGAQPTRFEYFVLGEELPSDTQLVQDFQSQSVRIAPDQDHHLMTLECLRLLAQNHQDFAYLNDALGTCSIDPKGGPPAFRASDLVDFTAAVDRTRITVLTPPWILYRIWLCLRRNFTLQRDPDPPSVGMCLQGGLGNQLFQMAALMHIARVLHRAPAIAEQAVPSSHSGHTYESVFSRWKYIPRHLSYGLTWKEPRLSYSVADIPKEDNTQHMKLNGYFQDYRYVDNGFLPHLNWPRPNVEKYPDLAEAVFVHVRGGDYLGSKTHHVPLEAYYPRAIAMFPPSTLFYLFTNDVPYAQSQPWLHTIRYRLIEESEVESLVLMGACGGGGICANSSFSWWGARMNPHRSLFMPDQWYLNSKMDSTGYYFPGVVQIPVQ